MTVSKGIAWNPIRGFVPVVACAQLFEEPCSNLSIVLESARYRLLPMPRPPIPQEPEMAGPRFSCA